MNKKLLAASVIVMAACMVPVHLTAQVRDVLKVQEKRLSNGMTVWLNEDHSQPKVFGAVVVNAGAKDCPDTGIAHYFEHIMFKGTDEIGTIDYAKEKPWLDSISASYDRLAATTDEATRQTIQKDINRLSLEAGKYAIPNEFNRLISRYGGTGLNAGTSWDFTYYHNSFTPQYIKQWCQLNSDRLIHPVFRLFQGELETVYEEKNMHSDNMLSSALDKLFAELFGTNPYAYPVLGSTENLKNPRLSAMREFYDKYYVGSNMGLVLCGDFASDSIMPLLEQTFGRIPRGVAPNRMKSPMPDITAERTVEIKIPVPLVNIEMLAYKAPTEYEKDFDALKIALRLLSNEQAGMLDSLVNENKMMMALASSQSLNDAGLMFIAFVPNLLASTSKAEQACMEQVNRLLAGNFSDEAFNTQKMEAIREANRELETIDERALQMVMVMSSGHTWQEYISKVNSLEKLTRADIEAAAKKYLNAPFIRFKKKNGNYEKDKISQPGYTPIVPQNSQAESEYAKRLAQMPYDVRPPRLLDFVKDATTIHLGGEANLYTVANPVNDLFELKISYNKGEKSDPRLAPAASLMNITGTDSLTRQQLASALQKIGGDIAFQSGERSFSIVVIGVDKHFEATMQLFNHLINHAAPTKKHISQIVDEKKAEVKSQSEENTDVLKALRQKVMFGENSTYLKQLSLSETKKLKAKDMLQAFNSIFNSACDISYSGSLPAEEVEKIVKKTVPVDRSKERYVDYTTNVMEYNEPVVYVYPMSKSRQTLVMTYEALPALPTQEQRAPFYLFEEYFGGGMSSVLFQEIREFRSMAYSTGSFKFSRPRKMNPNSKLAFGTVTGTQGDKAMSAITLIDSLLHQMPVNEKNFEGCRQDKINSINNDYPSFRSIGQQIAISHRYGYSEDSNTGMAELYEKGSMEDVKKFYDSHIRNNGSHRVWGIVGNKDKLDMNALSKYGKVVILKEGDLFRK